MKKTLVLISILLIATYTVFAMEVAEIELESTVAQVDTVEFDLGVSYQVSVDYADYDYTGNYTNTEELHPELEDDAYFAIKSLNQVNYNVPTVGEVAQTYTIDITPGVWMRNGIETEPNKTNETTKGALDTYTIATGDNYFVVTDVNHDFIVSFKPGITVADEPIGTFSIGWDPDSTLVAGDYKCKIEIAYGIGSDT